MFKSFVLMRVHSIAGGKIVLKKYEQTSNNEKSQLNNNEESPIRDNIMFLNPEKQVNTPKLNQLELFLQKFKIHYSKIENGCLTFGKRKFRYTSNGH